MKIGVIGGGPAGLYFALLMKKARPSWEITLAERNPPNVTWGWGVVFSDETLENFEQADAGTHAEITRSFARWTRIDVHVKGRVLRSGGHAFAGLRRMRLLEILQDRCLALGVDLEFEREITGVGDFAGADLVVAADGVNSRIRADLANRFRPDVAVGRSPYIWLATPRVFDAFTFIVRENEHGLFTVHAYPFDATMSTFIVETDETSWRNAGLDRATEARSLAYCERLFAPELGGQPLLGNKSEWIRFRRVKCESWRSGNVVLIGDAAHTAHFSIGSGTKLAMEDAIALSRALADHAGEDAPGAHDGGGTAAPTASGRPARKRRGGKILTLDGLREAVTTESPRGGSAAGAPPGPGLSGSPAGRRAAIDAALAAYEEARRVDVAKRQRVAEVSQRWFEEIRRYKDFDPVQFTVGLLSRSRKVTHGNLRIRDGAYVASVDRWFADRSGLAGVEPPPPPMFTPFRLRGLELPNRVVVSPMCMYSADDGAPNDWHLVHLGARAVGGAGLVIAEMTDVSREGRITLGCAGLYKDSHVAAWKRITDFVHAWTKSKIGIQLAHAGRKGSTKRPWEGRENEPLKEGGWSVLAPSAIPWAEGSPEPKAMERADMERVKDDFARAARRAEAAGFDLLELHVAHGYLLAEFLSPLTNRRTDAYGGTLENRLRFPLEVFDAIRAAWPEEKPISVRLNATDWVEGGFTPDEAVEAARALKAHGCDIVDVSSAWTTPESIPDFGSLYQVRFSDRVRNEAGIPTMTVGNIQNWDQINTVLASGHADLCVIARGHLVDPHFTMRAAIAQNVPDEVAWPSQYLPAKPRPKS